MHWVVESPTEKDRVEHRLKIGKRLHTKVCVCLFTLCVCVCVCGMVWREEKYVWLNLTKLENGGMAQTDFQGR